MSSRPLVYLLDAHFQIFRAYHSLPDLRAPDGSPVGAVRGYSATLIKFLRERSPKYVAAAFDHAMTSFRNELYPEYKAGRTEAPEDLEPQFSVCAEVTRALGIPLFELERFEADDVLATLTRRLLEEGADVLIVTRDKDLAALVCDRVGLFDLASGERSGPEEIEARLGVPPQLVADYLALMGDAVDHIPGVAGIGARTAAALLGAVGGIERLPTDAAAWGALEIRGAKRIAEKLAAGREQLELSQELVRLRDELPLAVKLADLQYRGARREPLETLFERLGSTSMLKRVPRWAD